MAQAGIMDETAQDFHRVCTRDRLRDEIVRRILDGRYPPNMHLKEMALAKEFGTSQAPVREALRDLEALGLVESRRYCGTRVRCANAVDLKEAYELRAVIECRAAQLAVPCDPSDLEILTAQVEAMDRAAQRRDAEAYALAALTFHHRIVAMSGNLHFVKAFEAMHWGVRARINIYRQVDALAKHVEDHARVLDYLSQGDGDKAGALLNTLLLDCARQLDETNQCVTL